MISLCPVFTYVIVLKMHNVYFYIAFKTKLIINNRYKGTFLLYMHELFKSKSEEFKIKVNLVILGKSAGK